MLPFLFQNIEKASYKVLIIFADYLWYEGTQLIMSSLFVAETGPKLCLKTVLRQRASNTP